MHGEIKSFHNKTFELEWSVRPHVCHFGVKPKLSSGHLEISILITRKLDFTPHQYYQMLLCSRGVKQQQQKHLGLLPPIKANLASSEIVSRGWNPLITLQGLSKPHRLRFMLLFADLMGRGGEELLAERLIGGESNFLPL